MIDTQQDGSPYILSLDAGPAHEDVRSQGYTLVAKSEFKSLEDMKFYDEGCEAHQVLKVCLAHTALCLCSRVLVLRVGGGRGRANVGGRREEGVGRRRWVESLEG